MCVDRGRTPRLNGFKRSPCVRTNDTIWDEASVPLELPHRGLGRGTKNAVRVHPEFCLNSLHRRSPVAASRRLPTSGIGHWYDHLG